VLGNEKLATLVKTERLTWQFLLQIATGQEACYTALNKFFSKVDWNEIAMVSMADRATLQMVSNFFGDFFLFVKRNDLTV